MKNLKLIIVLVGLISIFSCTDAERSKLGGYGDEFKIEMLNCDGTVARTWISSGKVKSEEASDGYFFKDKKTGKLIEVTGRLIITKE